MAPLLQSTATKSRSSRSLWAIVGACAALGACAVAFVVLGFLIGGPIPPPGSGKPARHSPGLRPSALQRTGPLCTDTCFKAHDGVCDEGWQPPQTGEAYQELLCDLGSDCSDCGRWEGHATPDAWQQGGPITYLRQAMDVELYIKETVTQPPMQMIYTNPTKDVDVSAHVHQYGTLEGGITEVFRMVLDGQCVDPDTGHRRLVLDVGANFGYFSVYAALHGCRVIAWEPVPHFRAILHQMLAINNVTHLVSVRDRVVSNADGENMTVSVPRRGIWGTASVGGINQFPGTEPRTVSVVSERVDSVVDEDVILMKVDVEGFEPLVFESASQLLSRRNVTNLVFEYNTGVAERIHETGPQLLRLVLDNPTMLMNLVRMGYRMGLMPDALAKWPFRQPSFPALREITAWMLEYDIRDAHAYTAALEALINKQAMPAVLGCPSKPELVQINNAWMYCLAMPQNAHPKSFRSSFGYNTNVWASNTPGLLKLAGHASAFPLDQNSVAEWFVRGQVGVGSRQCAHLPVDQLVRARCPCEYSQRANHPANVTAECMKEAAVISRLLADGRLGLRDFQFPTPLAVQG